MKAIDLKALFKALGDETRVRCLVLMHLEGELCVCELGYALGEAQPKISKHLGVLRKLGIVLDRRENQWVYYSLHHNLPEWAGTIISGAAQAAEEMDLFKDDCKRLAAMPDRPARCSGEDSEKCG
uniref:DNA-binding transcriptional repressor n=1 Tax=Magnetococcus massalia (strain MO-1) TaxID=451514 RepID=A0A1S7LGN5_MAGMO|nr:DNA-binding transcriptional repressor [Candidatus Magnetococcus massalia]